LHEKVTNNRQYLTLSNKKVIMNIGYVNTAN
jgi:hypothetical protein